ncbi:hypothetical protein AC579_7267 [Pseudocercospora musae]|uniref:Uncharacterized protein n=1 Tax=Pseudocercospora musae TaxID=113226 RepID=A0A139I3B5_9PEZI|nr:hypothetical protein AC579_7267 [Pseudocercospora musae]
MFPHWPLAQSILPAQQPWSDFQRRNVIRRNGRDGLVDGDGWIFEESDFHGKVSLTQTYLQTSFDILQETDTSEVKSSESVAEASLPKKATSGVEAGPKPAQPVHSLQSRARPTSRS